MHEKEQIGKELDLFVKKVDNNRVYSEKVV